MKPSSAKKHLNKRRCYSSKYALSGKVFCSKCGDTYRRISWNNRGKRTVVWKCATRVEGGPKACNGEIIQEEELHRSVMEAINQSIGNRDYILDILETNIESVIYSSRDGEIERIENELENLQTELLKKANSHQPYDELSDEIDRLREEKQITRIASCN